MFDDRHYHLALDMDDTLCSFLGPLIELARKEIGKNLRIPRYGEYNTWFPGQLTDTEREHLVTLCKREEFILSLPPAFSPLHGHSLTSVAEIAFEHFKSVSIVTARKSSLGKLAEPLTREWLINNKFPNAHRIDIHVCEHSCVKASYVCGPLILVDDNPKVARSFSTHPCHDDNKCILLEKIWNHGEPKSSSIVKIKERYLSSTLKYIADKQNDTAML